MKTSFALYLALTTLQVGIKGSVIGENDYICGTDVITAANIFKSIDKACHTLYHSRKVIRYPADYDASATFFISDARLFSWPLMKDERIFNTGRAGNIRLIIDSSCRFIGIIQKTTNQPDQRCFRPMKLPRDMVDSSNPLPGRLPVLRGYSCGGIVFDSVQVEKVRQETLEEFQRWNSVNHQISLTTLRVVQELYGSMVFLLPKKTPVSPTQLLRLADYSCFIVIDSNHKTLGMVSRSIDNWDKCDELWEMEPERHHIHHPQKNSVGETVFEGLTDYECGPFKFLRETINSHMQIACTIFQKIQMSSAHYQRGRLCSAQIDTDTGSFEVWKFPLQLPERDLITEHILSSNNCVIMLDEQCYFHGVYMYSKKTKEKCNQLFPQYVQETLDYEDEISDLSWVDEMIVDWSSPLK
ncbi:unnamed protein product [Blumeria hordei]|uniref:Candidate secreted effector protein n=1 Tax=Blumeria hordei TaxID=2867405 RepID=A0A383UJ51_BLUHO|nr:unnamed protein product [Blumeria hordei]